MLATDLVRDRAHLAVHLAVEALQQALRVVEICWVPVNFRTAPVVSAASRVMMAMTTRSSDRVKPVRAALRARIMNAVSSVRRVAAQGGAGPTSVALLDGGRQC